MKASSPIRNLLRAQLAGLSLEDKLKSLEITYSACEKIDQDLQKEEQTYQLVGQRYMMSDPYHADHKAIESQRAKVNSLIKQRETQVDHCIDSGFDVLKAILSQSKNNLASNPKLFKLYSTALSVRTRWRIYHIMGYLTLALILFGFVVILASLSYLFLIPVGVSGILWLMAKSYAKEKSIMIFIKEVADYVRTQNL